MGSCWRTAVNHIYHSRASLARGVHQQRKESTKAVSCFNYDKLWVEVRNAIGAVALEYSGYFGSRDDNWDWNMQDEMTDKVVEAVKLAEQRRALGNDHDGLSTGGRCENTDRAG